MLKKGPEEHKKNLWKLQMLLGEAGRNNYKKKSIL